MPAITRRTWANLRDEVIAACGGHDYTGFSGRVEYALTEAYYDTCCTYYQTELVKASAKTALSVNATGFSLPSDCFTVIALQLYQAVADGGAALGTLRYDRIPFVLAAQSITSAQPLSFYRAAGALVFNCPVDKAYQYLLEYYSFPTAPDFSGSASPTTHWLWDAHLVEGALSRMQNRIWRPDLADINANRLKDFLAAQTQPSLTQEPLPNVPDFPAANMPQGGNSG